MSRIGEKEIVVPGGVTVDISGSQIKVKGGKGELVLDLPGGISVKQDGDKVQVSRENEAREVRALHGTFRSLIANMIEGVVNGFVRELEIEGIGYKAQMRGNTFVLDSGFSHQIEYEAPEGVTIECDRGVKVKVSGADKQKVGQAAAQIRSFCKAEPYKGKGIRYKGERIRRKVGKTVA